MTKPKVIFFANPDNPAPSRQSTLLQDTPDTSRNASRAIHRNNYLHVQVDNAMRILAIETSVFPGEIALAEDDHILVEIPIDSKLRQTRALIPHIADTLAQQNWKPEQIELIAVSIGPGSFTGLRVGVTCAKTFAYAVGAKVVRVETLEAIAENCPDDEMCISVAADAQQQNVYRTEFRRNQNSSALYEAIPLEIISHQDWFTELDQKTLATGPVLNKLSERIPAECRIASPQLQNPHAGSIARLGWRNYEHHGASDLWSLEPRYYRKSAAEENWKARTPN